MTRRLILLAFVALAALGLASTPQPAAASPMEREARAMIQRGADQVIVILRDTKLPLAERNRRFRALFVAYFNIPAIARFTLGRNWRTASKEQKDRYLEAFETFIVKTYAIQLGEYTDERFRIVATGPDGKGVIVVSEIVTKGGQKVALKWRLRKTKAGLRVVDVLVENISMALTQKQDFASVIQQRGGIDGLIAVLENKSALLSAKETARMSAR